MATSKFESYQYASDDFVESAGVVMFRFSTRQICVLHLLNTNEYVLAKGRRNCGEASQDAAVREAIEETGYSCNLIPLNMSTRAPLHTEGENVVDEARFYTGILEPFTLQIRHLKKGQVKLIWWYVAAVDEKKPVKTNLEEQEKFTVEFYGYEEVMEKFTFQNDRDMVKKAIALVNDTYGDANHFDVCGGRLSTFYGQLSGNVAAGVGRVGAWWPTKIQVSALVLGLVGAAFLGTKVMARRR